MNKEYVSRKEVKKKEHLLQRLYGQEFLLLCFISAIATESYSYKDPTTSFKCASKCEL